MKYVYKVIPWLVGLLFILVFVFSWVAGLISLICVGILYGFFNIQVKLVPRWGNKIYISSRAAVPGPALVKSKTPPTPQAVLKSLGKVVGKSKKPARKRN